MPSPRREPLSFDDAQILRLESQAIKGHTGKLLVLDPGQAGHSLGAAALRERIRERLPGLSRLSQRVETARLRKPAWVADPDLDLAWHVFDAGGEPRDDEAFRREAGRLMAERLDHSRPLWRLDLLPLTNGRTGIVGRIHHAMADGVSAVRVAAALLWDAVDAPSPATSAPGRSVAPPSASARRAQEARLLVKLPRTVRRELRRGERSQLDRHIGPDRELAWRIYPLRRLKEIENAAGDGFTVNDVVLAVIAGALRRWLRSGSHNLRVQVPVSLHAREEDAARVGNRDSFLNVDLPTAEPDPLERLRLINAETREAKSEHDAETLYAFFHALGHFRPLYRGMTRITSGPREFALSVSNVPGPREHQRILGHPVAYFCSFAEPADRHALRVSIISLGGELALGLCSDPAAISGLGRLAAALDESIEELEGAVSVRGLSPGLGDVAEDPGGA